VKRDVAGGARAFVPPSPSHTLSEHLAPIVAYLVSHSRRPHSTIDC
jgi:hypothetical protein